VSERPRLSGETPIDLSHIKLPHVKTRAQLYRAEAENILKATSRYFGRRRPTQTMAPFDLPWLKRLHKQMFCDVWTWAGKSRKEQLNFGIDWRQIDRQLQEMLLSLKCWEDCDMEVLERAVRLHHRAVCIHPFPNGNGRWSRMLSNIYLRMHDNPVVRWPEGTIAGSSTATIRSDHIAALRLADLGDFGPLIALHRSNIDDGHSRSRLAP
jgi:Fic-DOC domain mobile mystery protein B